MSFLRCLDVFVGFRLFFLLVFCLFSEFSNSTNVGGIISVDTVWTLQDSPYDVDQISVQNGARLTIAPGVVVRMNHLSSLVIQSGVLEAVGGGVAPIVFTSSAIKPSPGDWGKMVFQKNSAASKLENVIVEYGAGIEINGASPVFNRVHIRKNSGAAIVLDSSSSPKGSGNRAEDNAINAIVVPAGDISGVVSWGLKGIPYLIESGVVSVGASPRIEVLTPNSLQQGKSATVSVSGKRLSGLGGVRFNIPGIDAVVLAGATDTSAILQVQASTSAKPGVAQFQAMTDAGALQVDGALTILAQQPVLSSVNPASIMVGQGVATVDLVGDLLTPKSQVLLGGNPIVATWLDASKIRFQISNQSESAALALRVRTPDDANPGQYFLSNEIFLPVQAQPLSFATASLDLFKGATRYLTLKLTHPAPAGGISIALSSSNSSIASVQGTAFFAEGTTSQTVGVTGSAAGSATITASQPGYVSAKAVVAVTVPPTLGIEPLPLAIPPDASSHGFNLRLSRADTSDHELNLALADSSFATITPATMVLTAGKTVISGAIKGLKAGQTTLIISSPTLGRIEVPVFITTDYQAMSVSFAAPVGVVVSEVVIPDGTKIDPIVSGQLGVVVGNYIASLSPDRFTVGSSNAELIVKGAGLADVRSVSVVPETGVSLGAPSIAADGRSLSVKVSVAADAPRQQRQLILRDGQGGEIPVLTPEANRFLITYPQPELISIDPLVVVPGQTFTMKVRGKNLQNASSIDLLPADGITIDNMGSLSIDSEGTSLTVKMIVAADAKLGERVLTVTTPGGVSSSVAAPSNVFRVAGSIKQYVTPIASNFLGVFVGDPNQPESKGWNASVVTRPLGLMVGSGITSVLPRVGIVGSTVSLKMTGSGLQGVDALKLVPEDGLVVSGITPSADGQSVIAQLQIDPAATKSMRQLQVSAAGVLVPFGGADQANILISAPTPEIDSMEPNYLLTGAAPQSIKVRGRNLTGATQLQILPEAGMTVSSPPVISADGRELTVNISATSGAATGKRIAVISTPAGDSGGNPTAANTLTLAEKVAGVVTPIVSAGVGVQVGSDSVASDPVSIGPVSSSLLGIQVGAIETANSSFSGIFKSADLGVRVGSVLEGMMPEGVIRGATTPVVFMGRNLQNVSKIELPQGVSAGTMQVSVDGNSITVPLTVDKESTLSFFRVNWSDSNGEIALASPIANRVLVGENLPTMTSMSPIVFKQGESISLTVRGSNLKGATALRISPAAGVDVLTAPQWSTDSFGEKLTVNIRVAADAVKSNRVVQVLAPWGVTVAEASVVNTVTITAP